MKSAKTAGVLRAKAELVKSLAVAGCGINIQVLWPGQPNGDYHAEQDQEDFPVLSGERLLPIEGQERRLRAWDFVHFPAGRRYRLPLSELGLRHGAGVRTQTTKPQEAYADVAETVAAAYRGGLPGDA